MNRAALALAACAAAAPAAAEPLRLRADALAQAQSPVGLLSLQADGEVRPWMSAEALVWTASDDGDGEADALVIAVRARDPEGRGEARVGRFVLVPGALRPVHLDGAAVRVALPWRLQVEAFGGVPVEPAFGAARDDWVAGTRVSRRIGRWGSVGAAYLHQRDDGRLADEEIGVDAAGAVSPSLDGNARVSFDLIDLGVSEARAAAGLRRAAWRGEVFGVHRSPSRLLPATSLFSVLGDGPSQQLGASGRWRAAPRLDLEALAALRHVQDDYGAHVSARALLRLDDRGDGALGLEVRRDLGWTGIRGTARVPLRDQLTGAAELELAIPDGDERGRLWPWALAALQWAPNAMWRAALAVEASASPAYESRFDALLRVSRAWEVAR